MLCCHASIGSVSGRPSGMTLALFITMSTRPNRRSAWSRTAVKSSSLVTSHRMTAASTPNALASCSTASARATPMSAMTRMAPACGTASAGARPLPLPSPVITATRPRTSSIAVLLRAVGCAMLREGTRGTRASGERAMDLRGTGVWSGALRYGDGIAARDAAAELEALGYAALWVPGGVGGDIFGDCRALLDATERTTVATGILNLWMHDPAETAAGHAALTSAYPDRFLLGIGVSHSALIDANEPGRYQKPLDVTRDYLDALDAQSPPVPVSERALA